MSVGQIDPGSAVYAQDEVSYILPGSSGESELTVQNGRPFIIVRYAALSQGPFGPPV